MTKDEALKLALEALENATPTGFNMERDKQFFAAITAIKEALAQPEQEPVAMKFKIYKPTVPDPTRQDINNALLPWVYDQDRSSGFDASMWVTPVATLPPQRKPLSENEIKHLWYEACQTNLELTSQLIVHLARNIEAAHGIKGLV